LIITLGSEKNRAAPRTSPRRSASDQARITATAAGRAAIPVGAGVGTTGSPAPSFGSGGNAADRAGARWAWRTVVLECEPLDPHPTTNPIAVIAMNGAQ
jgi:hypothetical protein